MWTVLVPMRCVSRLTPSRRRLEAAAKAAQDNAEALQAELTASRTAVEQASALARAAQERAEAVQQAEDARRVRGTWARLRAAWRGE